MNVHNEEHMFDLFNRPKLWTDFLSFSVKQKKWKKKQTLQKPVALTPESISINS